MNINDIREQKAQTAAQMRALLQKAESEKRDLSGDESASFDAMKSTIQSLEAQESRAAFLADIERGAKPDPAFQKVEQRITVLDAIRSQMEGRVSGALAEYQAEAEKRNGRKAEGVYVPLSAFETRVSTTTTASEITPDDFRADQYIGPLRNSLLMRSMGIRTLTGLRGDVVIPKHGASLIAGWVNENEALSASDMSFDDVRLEPKHVGALTELSRQLIQQSSPDINGLVRDDLNAVMAQALDTALIMGTGVKDPLGIINVDDIQTGSISSVPTWAELLELSDMLDVLNVTGYRYLTSPGVMKLLRGTQKETGTGNYLATTGSIGDVPASVTNQMPAGTLLLGDFSQMLLGVWSEVDILVNPYAETAYSKGNVLVRAMMTAGAAVRHPEAFVLASVQS